MGMGIGATYLYAKEVGDVHDGNMQRFRGLREEGRKR
jgi:hypothetical protein